MKKLYCSLLALASSCGLFLSQARADVSVVVTPPTNHFTVGGSATFHAQVTATAGESIRGYAWLVSTNDNPPTTTIPGATSQTLILNNVQPAQAGHYYAEVFYDAQGETGLSAQSGPAYLFPLIAPQITSSTNAFGLEGVPFSFTVTATGSIPLSFGATGLPPGLNIDTNSGVISGIPNGLGLYTATVYATNVLATQSNLVINIASDIPGITSDLVAHGQQGVPFFYTITASNTPNFFAASGLPPGLNVNSTNGVISGVSLLGGSFPITISAGNQWGADTKTLTLNLASDAPVITSPPIAAGIENQGFFSYAITALNSPTTFSAIGLPPGLLLNTDTGLITGALLFGGTNTIQIYAANPYGVGSSSLTLQIANAPLPGLAIVNVTNFYSSPYLLDFTFTLRDDPAAATDPAAGNPVVRPPQDLTVQCYEGDLQTSNAVPIGNETTYIVNKAIDSKTFKTFFALDYTASMYETPDAIPDMQAAVENLINEEPASAQFGVVEFSADYLAPQTVTGFTADKALLGADIEGIQTNFVQGNYGGTRMYDALAQALGNFTGNNLDIENFVVLMSDGWDDSSTLQTDTNFPTPVDVLVNMAASNNVKIYCIGFGPDPDTNSLETLAGKTGGHYYPAVNPAEVASQFAQLLKDLDSEYVLRWATLQRTAIGFQPMFTVTVDGQTAGFNTQFTLVANPPIVDTNTMPPTTNITYTNISEAPFYVPAQWTGNVRMGNLGLDADAVTNVSAVTLTATYVPRFTREIRLHYRANYPCSPALLNNDPGQILYGWTLSQTNDGGGGQWLTLASPDTNNAATSLPYGILSDLIRFQFPSHAVPIGKDAFAFISVDNSIYTNVVPNPQGFSLSNSPSFTTNYPVAPAFGTPVPWLESFGFTNTTNFDAIELSSPNNNGLALWQDYIAGLNPLDTNSTFGITQFTPPQTNRVPSVTFNTTLGRVYRIDASTPLGQWLVLQDNINGTGGPVTIYDNRDLSGVHSLFYRVVVRYPFQ